MKNSEIIKKVVGALDWELIFEVETIKKNPDIAMMMPDLLDLIEFIYQNKIDYFVSDKFVIEIKQFFTPTQIGIYYTCTSAKSEDLDMNGHADSTLNSLKRLMEEAVEEENYELASAIKKRLEQEKK